MTPCCSNLCFKVSALLGSLLCSLTGLALEFLVYFHFFACSLWSRAEPRALYTLCMCFTNSESHSQPHQNFLLSTILNLNYEK